MTTVGLPPKSGSMALEWHENGEVFSQQVTTRTGPLELTDGGYWDETGRTLD